MSANNESYDELCYEIDEINRKWAEDNERNGDIMAEQQEQIIRLEEENEKLQEHYDNSIHTDWIAEAAGEDPEYHRDVCCADTLGAMIKENRNLKDENSKLKEENKKLKEECGAMNVIEKLNKEFDEIQTENQKLVEEVELKAETIKEQQVELEVMTFWLKYKNIDHFPDRLRFWYDNGENIQKKLDVDIGYHPDYDKVFYEWYPLYGTGFNDLPPIPEFLQRECEKYEDNFEDYLFEEIVENY